MVEAGHGDEDLRESVGEQVGNDLVLMENVQNETSGVNDGDVVGETYHDDDYVTEGGCFRP